MNKMGLTKEKYLNLVDVLADEDKFDEYVWNFVFPDDDLSCANVEQARDYIVGNLKELIKEHFDNPPLKFEELKPNMWVWDNKIKEYRKIDRVNKKYHGIEYFNTYGWFIEFEENRLYKYEVK